MSSMPTSHTFNMTGGTFIQVHGDAHYHGFRGPGASLLKETFYVKLTDV